MLVVTWWGDVSGGCCRGFTLRCQHGSCSLMEVEQLLQEQDGLQETNASHDPLHSCCWPFPGRPPRLLRSRERAEAVCEGVDSPVLQEQTHPSLLHNLCLCVCVCVSVCACLHCWSAHARFHPWACCTLCQGYSADIEKVELQFTWLLIVCTGEITGFSQLRLSMAQVLMQVNFIQSLHWIKWFWFTLMLSANSSRALAPIVSMEVMSVGSLFLVLAAVPCRQKPVAFTSYN